jgi:hypothetical protein
MMPINSLFEVLEPENTKTANTTNEEKKRIEVSDVEKRTSARERCEEVLELECHDRRIEEEGEEDVSGDND